MTKQKILLLTLEFPQWPDAAKFVYEGNFGLEECLQAQGIDCLTIPVMYGNSTTAWAKWFDLIRPRLQGKAFDQVWFEVTHSRIPEQFLEFIDSLAPVRLGFVFESIENTPEGIAWNPAAAKARNDNLAVNLRHATHLVVVDEADLARFNLEGKTPAFWWASGPIPQRLMAAAPLPPTKAPAVFHGTLYGDRAQWLQHPELAGLLAYGSSLEADTPFPAQWERLSGKLHTALIENEPINDEIFFGYVDFIRMVRRKTYPLWLKSLVDGAAVVCLPSYVLAYPSRVPQGMAAGRPVTAFEIPNRPRIRSLYESGSEILLYTQPGELAEHIRHIQRDPAYGRNIARNALAKMRRFHTEEKFVADILSWIENGVEPDYGDGVGARYTFAAARWLTPRDLAAAQEEAAVTRFSLAPAADASPAQAGVLSFQTVKSGGADGPLAPEVMAELAAKFRLNVFIETGTYLGDTSAAAVPLFDEIHTIELAPELAQKAAQRFAGIGKVRVHQGDSADRLGEILAQTKGAPLIWLDGHYSEGVTARGRENTPVIDELQSIEDSGISNAVILIDDLRMFDARETKAGDPPSLAGYPSLQELHRQVASMQQKYEMYVYGDAALILPSGAGVQVSSVVQAQTISRLYDGVNLSLEEVIAAEDIIAAAQGLERDALRKLAASRSVQINEQYAQGLHYRYWDGLAALRDDAAAAEQQFAKAKQLGFTHSPVNWFHAQACAQLGKSAEHEKFLTELLAVHPGFSPAITMLDHTRAAANARVAAARRAQSAPVPAPAPKASPASSLGLAPAQLPLDEIHDFNQRQRDRWVQAKAATIPKGSRVLDMGAGTCLYRPLFAHCDYKTHDFMQYEGAEKHGGTSAYGRIDYVSEILAIPAPDHSFDVILCTEVLEHVPEPIKVLKEISRLLRPGGRAFITAPLGSGLHQLPFHFYGGYTPEWYRRFSKEAGMEATEITPNGGFFKHLAQECARAGNIYGQNPQLHGPEAAELHKLLIEHMPRLLFALDEKVFDERFTVGYFVEAVKCPVNSGGAKETPVRHTASQPTPGPVVVKMMGGMGNQMFQYAAGLALARRTGTKLTLDLSFLLDRTPRPDFVYRGYDLDLFELAPDCEVSRVAVEVAQQLPQLQEKQFNYDPRFETLNDGAFLDGYWQSPRYFESVADEVRRTFTAFRTALTPKQQAMADRIRQCRSVCVNVRRGDFVSTPQGRSCHGVCDERYFRDAAAVIRHRMPEAHFFIFSDDVEWCRKANLLDGAPCTFIGHDYAGDRFGAYLQLMMACRHFIVPNSTFGWWAAFLSNAPDKIVIAPEPWFSSTDLDSSDLLPKEWIRLCRNPGPHDSDPATAPMVSVIVPCYKQAHYLPVAVASVVAQTFADWELLIVNDGSPDDTSRVAQEIIACYPDRRIRLFEKPNGGLASARNAGITAASGRYILPLDADDKLAPAFLAKTVAFLEANPGAKIVTTGRKDFGASQKVYTFAKYTLEELVHYNRICYCTLYRREIWEAVGGYNPNMTWGYEDWDFWIGCAERGWFAESLPDILFHYRVKSESMYVEALKHDAELRAQIILNHSRLFAPELLERARTILAEQPARTGAEMSKPCVNGLAVQSGKQTRGQLALREAETLARSSKFDAAVACVGQALDFEPTADCANKAEEVMRLIAELQQAANTDAAETARTTTDDFFGAEECGEIMRVIGAYSANRPDPDAKSQVVALRQGLVDFLDKADDCQLESLYKGDFGQVCRALLRCGLNCEPLTVEEKAAVDSLATEITASGSLRPTCLLSLMLRTPTSRVSLPDLSDRIPSWLINDYIGDGLPRVEAQPEPLVSVIVPCYKQAEYLPEAVASIVAQTLSNWELIIVNDGSPDETSRVAREIIAANPQRTIRLVEKKNGGLADARNAGIRAARGKYILPLDADDKIHPEMLAKTAPVLDENSNIGIVYTDYVYFGHLTQKMCTTEYNFKTLCTAYNQFTCTSLFRKAAWVAVGGYNPNMVFGYEDWDFWIGCGEKGFVGRRIPEVLFFYRTKKDSMVAGARTKHLALFSRIILNHAHLYAPSVVKEAADNLAKAGMLDAPKNESLTVRGVFPAGDRPAVSAQPLVSICIPTYNGEEFLAEAIASAVAQSYPAIEIIVSDDDSTDRTLEVAAAALTNSRFPVRVLKHERLGLVRNWNHCIDQSRGKYIKFLFQDDLLEPDCVSKLVEVAEGDPMIGLVFSPRKVELSQRDLGNAELQRGKRSAQDVHLHWSKLAPVQSGAALLRDPKLLRVPLNKVGEPTTVLLSKSVLEAIGGFDEKLTQLVDFEMWLRIMTRYNVGFVDQTLSCFRIHRKQATQLNTKAGLVEEDGRRLFAMLASDPRYSGLPAIHRTYVAQALSYLDKCAASIPSPQEPLVSVIVPCYKQAEYLPEAVASVVAQTFSNWELIIVNDGSPDETSRVAHEIIAANPQRTIRLVEKKNGGLADARNAGIRAARGKYILPLDADDRIHPEMLARTAALLECDATVAIAYCDWQYFGAENHTREAIDYDFARLATKENLFTCTSLFRKEAWDAAGGYNTNMTHGLEDWDFWVGCGEHGYFGQRIPEVLFFYRAKAGSMIQKLRPHVPVMFAQIVANHPRVYDSATVAKARATLAAAAQADSQPVAIPAEVKSSAANPADFHSSIQRVEALVRNGQIVEALAAAEHARALAPNAECIACAEQVLALVRAAGQGEPPLSVAADDRGENDFFGSEECGAIEGLLAAYAEKPTCPESLGQVSALRQGLVDYLGGADNGRCEKLFTGDFAKVYRLVLKSGLNAEPLDAVQRAAANALAAALAGTGELEVAKLLALALFSPAHHASIPFELERLPAWFLDDYLAYVLHAPQVFVVAGEAEVYRDHMLAWARSIHRRTRSAPTDQLTLKVAEYFALKANYIPLYFTDSNTKELAEKRAGIMEFFLETKGAALDAALPKRPANRKKIKVGYLNAHFSTQTETHVTLPTLRLDRAKFEICLFPLHSAGGPVEEYCRSLADAFIPLPADLGQQVKAIREARLDVIIIGTNVTAVTNQVSLLALHRLAPLQLVSYCSPVSTGMRNVDGYLSGTFNEFTGVEEQFTEKLQLCEGPPGCLDYTVENKVPASRFERASLGIGDDEVVFVNAAACFKILPEMQETWAKILKAVDKSRLLLLPFNPNWHNNFPVKQFTRTLTEAFNRHGLGEDRFILANSLPSRADVKELEKVADVYLDTFPFSGSISVIDPLELGIPPVVWEGKTHRSQMAAALLRELDLPELITRDEASYIQACVRLGTDSAYRKQIQTRVLAAMAKKPRFINPIAYGKQLSALIERLVMGGNKPKSVANKSRQNTSPAPVLVV